LRKRIKTNQIIISSFMIAPWQETKWIVLSSCLFLIPSWYAFQNHLYGNAWLLLTMSLISANYWRNARISWRRTTDLIFSKLMTILFVTKAFFYINTLCSQVVCIVSATGVVYFYYYSCTFHSEKKECWVQYHVLFHCFMTVEMWLVVCHSISSK